MNEGTEREYQECRIAYQQARKALRLANPKRQYGNHAVDRFRTKASELVDLFAVYVDEQMIREPNTGHGCRVQQGHINMCFIKMKAEMEDYIIKERELMLAVRIAMNRKEGEEE